MRIRQAVNPFLPSYEYIPDGEPHVFGDRVYLYGSHDKFNGVSFCRGDYVCWSASVDDLTTWDYEGIIYRRRQDPKAPLFSLVNTLYAPDVARGADGKRPCRARSPSAGRGYRKKRNTEKRQPLIQPPSTTSAIAGWSAVALLRNLASPIQFF